MAFVGFLLISLNDLDLVTTVSSVLTCLGNAGPGFGQVGPALNFSILSDFSKLVLSLLMIAGRLELFTFFHAVFRRVTGTVIRRDQEVGKFETKKQR